MGRGVGGGGRGSTALSSAQRIRQIEAGRTGDDTREAVAAYLERDGRHSDPANRSLTTLWPLVERIEGSSRGGGLYPFSVRLTREGADLLGRDNVFITRVTGLHEAAARYEDLLNQ